MISVAKKHLPFVTTMISWDGLRFKNFFPGTVFTPDIFLEG
jgi:hypothetical protein